MRLRLCLRNWLKDESGLVLVLTALVLPVILLLGTMVLQSGQSYQRQAQLQFLARQSANRALLKVSRHFENQARANYQSQCGVELPPSICSSDDWADFLSVSEAVALAQSDTLREEVKATVESFALQYDPAQALMVEAVRSEFPLTQIADRISLRVTFSEPLRNWVGAFNSPEEVTIEVESLSYLSLNS
jgi:Flp pilus assembly protein TadG